MIVVEINRDSATVVEQASFDDEFMNGVQYVMFEFTRDDAKDMLDALKFLSESEWNKVSKYAGHDWFSSDESEEGCYPNVENIQPTKERMCGDEMVINKGGDGYVKGYEKYTGTQAYSNSFLWWPLIALYVDDMKMTIDSKIRFDGPWAHTEYDVSINPLTGEITHRHECSKLDETDDKASVSYVSSDGKTQSISASIVNGVWRVDEGSLYMVQSEFSERVKAFIGY